MDKNILEYLKKNMPDWTISVKQNDTWEIISLLSEITIIDDTKFKLYSKEFNMSDIKRIEK